MKKYKPYKQFLCFLTSALLLFAGTPLSAYAEVTVEQTQSDMPEIDVYVHQNEHDLATIPKESITAALDGVPLDVLSFTPTEQGVFYVIMLDVSGSMLPTDVTATTDAVKRLHATLGPEDELAFMTFGTDVKMLLAGGEDTETVHAALDGIVANDNYTHLSDALYKLVEISAAKKDMRHVAILVSDGVSTGNPTVTPEQLEEHLRHSGVAVYALATSKTGNLQQFTDFIELTGGKLEPFTHENAQEKFDKVFATTDLIWHLKLSADSNFIDGELHKLSVSFGDVSTIETEIRPTDWQEDTTIPALLDHSIDFEAKTVTLVFSERLSNADDPAVYQLTYNDTVYPATPVVTEPGSINAPSTVVLSCPELYDLIGWNLKLDGLTDYSMEKNAMPALELVLSTTPPDTVAPYLVDSAVDLTAKTITLTFSEPLSNADDSAVYHLTSNGVTYKAEPALKTTDGVTDPTTVILTCPELNDTEDWSLTIDGLTDSSLFQNPMTAETIALIKKPVATPTPTVTEAPVITEAPAAPENPEASNSVSSLFLILGILLLLVTIALIVLFLLRKKQEGHNEEIDMEIERQKEKRRAEAEARKLEKQAQKEQTQAEAAERKLEQQEQRQREKLEKQEQHQKDRAEAAAKKLEKLKQKDKERDELNAKRLKQRKEKEQAKAAAKELAEQQKKERAEAATKKRTSRSLKSKNGLTFEFVDSSSATTKKDKPGKK